MAEPWWKADRKQSRWTPSTGLVKRPKGIQHSQQLSTVPRASRGSNVLVIWTLCSARGFTAADSAAPLLCWAEGDPRPVYLGEGVSVEVWTALCKPLAAPLGDSLTPAAVSVLPAVTECCSWLAWPVTMWGCYLVTPLATGLPLDGCHWIRPQS